MAKLHLFCFSLCACINEYAEKTSLILYKRARAISLSLSPSPSFFLRRELSKYSFFFPSSLFSFGLSPSKVLSRRHEYLTKTKYSHMLLCAAHNGTIISSTIIASSSSSSRGRRQRPEKSFWTTTTIKTRTSICLHASSSSSNNNEEKEEEEEEEEDIFEVIRENLPFFIGGMVAGTFGLSITDDSSPLKGWVEDRKKSSMSSLSQNNKLVEPSPSSIRIRQEEEAVFTVPTTKTTLENNNNDNISSTE